MVAQQAAQYYTNDKNTEQCAMYVSVMKSCGASGRSWKKSRQRKKTVYVTKYLVRRIVVNERKK